jgi:hypothetical protein
MVAGEDEHT